MLRLQGKVQHYEWGRMGARSEVGRLHATASGSPAMEDVPYAELWLGTHESGPSVVLTDDDGGKQVPLRLWLEAHPEALGKAALSRWGGELPFLLKVLSVGKALSIQAHPDKALAARLHRLHPDLYKDPNHKPEMAIALTEFQALCGFLPPGEMAAALRSVPELRAGMGESAAAILLKQSADLPTKAAKEENDAKTEKVKARRQESNGYGGNGNSSNGNSSNGHGSNGKAHDEEEEEGGGEGEEESTRKALEDGFRELMSRNPVEVQILVEKLMKRLQQERAQGGRWSPREELAVRLDKQYPGDVGVLASLLLNHVKLAPGEAMALEAGEPHAYLSGDCVECMATSDNVVRAGLTPKFRDTRTLCAMLRYRRAAPELLPGEPAGDFTTRYAPAFDEFEVDHIALPPAQSLLLRPIPGPCVLLVQQGRGVARPSSAQLAPGAAFFVPAHQSLELSATSDSFLHVYRAGVSSRLLFQHQQQRQETAVLER